MTATATAPAKAAKGKGPEKEKEKEIRLRGRIQEWTAWKPGTPPRRYIELTLTYRQFSAYFYIKPYTDKTKDGWQRRQVQSHVRYLRGQMADDLYSPTAFYGGVHESHRDGFGFFKKADEFGVEHDWVEIPVTPSSPLPCTDGGHRGTSLEGEVEKARQEGRLDEVERIYRQPISLMIMLEPEKVPTDFLAYQKGRNIDKDLEKSMNIRHGQLSPEQRDMLAFASDVCHKLDKDKRSHLFQKVSFDDTTGGQLRFSALTMDSSANQGCTLIGGTRIARHFKKSAAWLASTYVEAYNALLEHCEAEEKGDIPIVLLPNQFLTPINLKGGRRGGTAFIIGMGNLLAWRKASLGHDRATPEEVSLIARIADEYYRRDVIGWSGEDKRRELGDYARLFFADVLAPEGEAPGKGQLKGFEGLPYHLFDILPPSTFKLEKEAGRLLRGLKAAEEKAKKDGPLAGQASFFDDTIADGVQVKPARR